MFTRALATPDRLLRAGGGLMVFGMCATLLTFSPLGRGSSWWWVLGMSTGAGLVLVLAGVLRQARARSRAVAALKERK